MLVSAFHLFLFINLAESQQVKEGNISRSLEVKEKNAHAVNSQKGFEQQNGLLASNSLSKHRLTTCSNDGNGNETFLVHVFHSTHSAVGHCEPPTLVRANRWYLSESSMSKKVNVTSLSIRFNALSKDEEEDGNQNIYALVGDITWQLLEPRIHECHFVLMTRDSSRPFASYIIRKISMACHPMVVLDFGAQRFNDTLQLSSNIWDSLASITCRTLLIDLTGGDQEMFSFLERSKFYERPNIQVLFVGRRRNARSTIMHATYRNTINTLYLGLQTGTVESLSIKKKPLLQNAQDLKLDIETEMESVLKERIILYSGCLFCDKGQTKVLVRGSVALGSKIPLKNFRLSTGEVKNLYGHLMRIGSVRYTPYADYIQSKDGPGGIVIQLDSLDKRLIEAFAPIMNFSYVVRTPPDSSFGYRLPDGNWTGVHGLIQRGEADFTTSVGTSPARLEVVEFERTVLMDPLVIISLKPQPLPQYLVFLTPFTVEVWTSVFSLIMVWGTSLWLLQKIRCQFRREGSIAYNSAIFYSLAVILEDPPCRPPSNVTGQILVGWWLIACFLIMSGFKSSLVAHLAVVAQTKPINTYRDLVTVRNWKWGIDTRLISGMVRFYFTENIDPDVRYIYEMNEREYPEDGLERVLKGRFSLLATKNRITTIIGEIYKKEVSETPFYLGKQGYYVFKYGGWGIRRGAPFRPYINKLINRILDTGIMDYWVQDVVHSKILRSKAEARQERQQEFQQSNQYDPLAVSSDDGKRILGMVHMMGVFLLMIHGLIIATLVFLIERLIKRRPGHQKRR